MISTHPRVTALRHRPLREDAFTLIELLITMGTIAILLSIVTPVLRISSLAPGIAGIAGTLEQARAYAMANSTYVYVGIAELDVAKDSSAAPQTAGTGRVVVATVASRDGTRGYDVITPEADWKSNYNNGARLVAINTLQRYDNLHIPDTLDASGTPPATGSMARPAVDALYRLGNTDANSVSITPFDWPLGKDLGTGQYSFTKVIQFDPQGVARMPHKTDPENIVVAMELSLQPTRGNASPPVPQTSAAGNHAAIQLDAMTGGVRIFRP